MWNTFTGLLVKDDNVPFGVEKLSLPCSNYVLFCFHMADTILDLQSTLRKIRFTILTQIFASRHYFTIQCSDLEIHMNLKSPKTVYNLFQLWLEQMFSWYITNIVMTIKCQIKGHYHLPLISRCRYYIRKHWFDASMWYFVSFVPFRLPIHGKVVAHARFPESYGVVFEYSWTKSANLLS